MVRKVGFLHHVIVSNPVSLTGRVMLALCDDADSLCLLKEFKELEERFGSTLTDIILSRNLCSIREMKKETLELDKEKRGDRCLEKASMIAEVSRRIGWVWLWDAALDLRWKRVKGLQLLNRALCHLGRGNHPYNLCDTSPPLKVSVLEHILVSHWEELYLDPELDYKKLMNLLEKLHLGVLSKFSNTFITYCFFKFQIVPTGGFSNETLNIVLIAIIIIASG